MELKGDLSIRPIYHQLDKRIEAHILIAFLAYCLQVTLKQRLKALAPGLTPRDVLEKFAAIQMIDVELPTTDGRLVVLRRYTEPEGDQRLLLQRLQLQLPKQPAAQDRRLRRRLILTSWRRRRRGSLSPAQTFEESSRRGRRRL